MKLRIYIMIFFTGMVLTACQKNIDVFVPDPGQLNGPDTTWKNTVTAAMPVSVLKNNLLQEPYRDSVIIGAAAATVNTPFGIQINFPPNCCTNAAGQVINGKVQVEVALAKKKGDMIRLNRPSTSDDSLMVTAGEIFVKLKTDSQTLQLAPGARLYIHYADLPGNQQMKLFVGDESDPNHFNWLPNPDLANNTLVAGTQGYEIYTNRLRWVGVSYLYDFANTTRVHVSADIASYFTNANTIAFTVFKDMRSVVAMRGELSSRKFITPKLPVGKQITVVVISKQGNDYYLGHGSAVTLSPTTGSVQQVQVVPIKTSLPQILSYLSTL